MEKITETPNTEQPKSPVTLSPGCAIFDLGNGYTVEFDDDCDGDFPFVLYCGDDQLDYWETGKEALTDLNYYDDDIIPPSKWSDLWDWALFDRV